MIAAIGKIISAAPRQFLWRSAAVLLLSAGCLCLSGCGSSGFSYAGTWVGFRDLKPEPGQDPSAIRSIAKIELTIHDDGTFDLFQTGIPKAGKVRSTSEGARLEVEYLFETSIENAEPSVRERNKEIHVRPLDDGALEFTDVGDFDPTPIRLERKTDKPSS